MFYFYKKVYKIFRKSDNQEKPVISVKKILATIISQELKDLTFLKQEKLIKAHKGNSIAYYFDTLITVNDFNDVLIRIKDILCMDIVSETAELTNSVVYFDGVLPITFSVVETEKSLVVNFVSITTD